MSTLSQRPQNPSVGVPMPHESAALHVTGAALYTDDLVHRTKDVLHAYPVQVMSAHARILALNTAPALAALQEVGADLGSHAARDLAHRCEEG